ncbi:MAG: exo-alpha-sialidase, partial [Planctomycetaceae bacterium]|nr:exo-alpha-sialidase [Planctomycetaceae bacterium]
WNRGQATPEPEQTKGKRVLLQEPGVVALKEDRLMLWCRTDAGSQYVAYSQDQGKTWTKPKPSNIISPVSPATIERIPSTGNLLLVWNDHRDIPATLRGKRTPLCAAVSTDEGQTWKHLKILENNPNGWYCYTAMAFIEDHVLLAYCAGDRRMTNGLALTQITRFPVKWIDNKPEPAPSR